MPADKPKPGKPREDKDDFVPAVFARDADDAESYVELLKDHDIPAICGSDEPLAKKGESGSSAAAGGQGVTRGVPVLVPEELLDEASEVIADRENLAEYGLADAEEEEDEDDEDFGFAEDVEGAEITEEDLDEDQDFFDEEDLEDEEDI